MTRVADIKVVNSGTVLGEESFNNVGFDFPEVLTCEAINLSGGDVHPLAGQEAPDLVTLIDSRTARTMARYRNRIRGARFAV